jgi:hypothetical protein
VTTPRATQFFGWIMGLLVVIAMVIPLSLVVNMDDKIATALLNMLIGLAITIPLVNVSYITRANRVRPVTKTGDVPPPTRQWDV